MYFYVSCSFDIYNVQFHDKKINTLNCHCMHYMTETGDWFNPSHQILICFNYFSEIKGGETKSIYLIPIHDLFIKNYLEIKVKVEMDQCYQNATSSYRMNQDKAECGNMILQKEGCCYSILFHTAY